MAAAAPSTMQWWWRFEERVHEFFLET
jgi:hypothetical protein